MKIGDIFIIVFAVGITVFSVYGAYLKPQDTSRVVVQAQGKKWIFPVDAQETVIAAGPLGNTVVRIEGGLAWVESSPCQNQTCVAAGTVRRQGSWTACLPNNVLLMIEGTKENDVDAVVR